MNHVISAPSYPIVGDGTECNGGPFWIPQDKRVKLGTLWLASVIVGIEWLT